MVKAFNMVVRYKDEKGWASKVNLSNLKFCEDSAIEGEIKCKYYLKSLIESIDILLDNLACLNIELHDNFEILYLDNYKGTEECPPKYEEEFIEACKYLKMKINEKRS